MFPFHFFLSFLIKKKKNYYLQGKSKNTLMQYCVLHKRAQQFTGQVIF